MFSEPVITFIKSESLFVLAKSLDNNTIPPYAISIVYCDIKTNNDTEY